MINLLSEPRIKFTNTINEKPIIKLNILKSFSFQIFFLFCTLFYIHSNVYCLDSLKTRHTTILQDLGNDIVTGLQDAGNYYTSPLRFNSSAWFYTGMLIDGIAVSTTLDYNIKQKASRNNVTSYNHDFWDIPTAYGDVIYPASASGIIYAFGLFTRNDKIRVTGRLLIEALGIAGVSVTTLKFITGRDRPFYRNDPYWFKAFQTKNEHLSFSSGHAAVAFAVSSVLAERFDNNYLRVGLYGFAALTAYARIHNNQHWFSDVVLGSLIGFSSGYFVVHREQDRNENKTKNGGFSIYPSLNGLGVVWKF